MMQRKTEMKMDEKIEVGQSFAFASGLNSQIEIQKSFLFDKQKSC